MNEKLLLNNLDWKLLLNYLSDFATSTQAKQTLVNTSPLNSPMQAEKSFQTINECKAVLKTGIRPNMLSLELFESWYNLINKNSELKPLHIKDLRFFLIEAMALKETLTKFKSDTINEHMQNFFSPEDGINKIENLLTIDGFIRTDASQALYDLNKSKKDLSKNIQKTLDKLVKSYKIEDIIQDKFVTTREGRWVIPIKSDLRSRFEGVIHDSSQSKQTVFMEPTEVIVTNNKIREIEVQIKEEINRLLKDISNYFYNMKDDLKFAFDCLLFFDINFSKAQLALKTDAHVCNFNDKTIYLNLVKNPVLLLQDEKVIPNIVELNKDKRILLLSGPNAGGKTVLLKSIGLNLHMASCGLLICAQPDSEIPFIKRIISSVGDHQSVSQNLSSFASHLKILDLATGAKDLSSLILVDEICSSTDPEEGSALARSFIENYSDNNVFAVITSHFSYLKDNLNEVPSVVSGSLEFDIKTGPTYKFLQGVSGQSLAIQTAKRVGISEDIVNKALDYMSPEKKNYFDNIDEVSKLKDSLHAKTKETDDLKRKYHKEINRYRLLVEKYEKEKEIMLEKSILRAERKIDKMIQVNKAGKVLSNNTELQKVKQQLPEVVKPNLKNDPNTPQTVEEFAKKFPPGSKVFISSLNKEGLVQSSPNKKGLVDVVSQSMRLQLNWKLLKLNTSNLINPADQILKNKGFFKLSSNSGEEALDLRGLSVDEAIAKIEIELDKATLQQADRVKIIHGHGTNSLKRAVRSYLSRCLYVKTWASGSKNSGGDGVTWVTLKDD